MKKTVLFISFALFASISVAQKSNDYFRPDLPIDEETQLVTYQEVIPEVGTSEELYDRATIWTKKEYVNTNEVIKNAERDKGVLELRSSVRIYSKARDGKPFFKNIVYYRLKIECREGRYRYTITDFNEKATAAAPVEVWYNVDSPHWTPIQYDYLKQIDEQIKDLILSLKKGMEPIPEKIDEW